MKKLLTTLMVTLVGSTVFAQWTQTSFKNVENKKRGSGFVVKSTSIRDGDYYKLDLGLLQSQLKNAQETGANAKPVEILLPTSNGKIERFAVYSFPVVVKELADQYQLGSYVGIGIDDPSKSLRFSVAPNDFQSMIMKSGTYEFIDAQNADKTVYAVHLKTNKSKEGFVCSSEESPQAKQQMEQLYQQGKSFYNQPTNFSKLSDKKYRTMRLVMSVTGEYSQFFGGTLAGSLAQINATLTRVNFVFEKDFALHLNLQNYPQLIYLDPTTDPYATVADAYTPPSSWNQALQTAITNAAGNGSYDIGHLFGASGGGGNAGCIGCICVNPTTAVPLGKGAAITSPLTGSINPSPSAPPSGDTFDIDFVAHEMGHQLSATHSFSHEIQGGGAQMEPGSGSTIMGYAGITGPNTDVQPNSNAYFHAVNIKQVQANLISKTCDIETTITNNPPVITALSTFNIPKGTAFVLTASATDPENDPLTYTWEEMDPAGVVINKNNLGNTSTGASFRSLTPTTSPTRYFPKLTSVLNGVLNNSNNQWESVSTVARTTKFSVTVRDNNPNPLQQQTQFAEQTIIVGDNGPFKVTTTVAEANGSPTSISWAVANTTAAPYNVANVKIDYTTDNGTTWTVLSASTPNDGSESFTFPTSLNGSTVKMRVSSIGNVFYAIGSVALTTLSPCSSTAPSGLTVIPSLNGASIYWTPYSGTNTTYIVRYKKTTDVTWTEVSTSGSAINVSGLTAGAYEAQVAAVCSGTTGTYSTSVNFTVTTFSTVTYCNSSTGSAAYERITNVSLANVNNASGPSTYTNYTTNPSLQINLVKGASPYALTVSVGSADTYDAAAVWIDWNRNGTFEDSEQVLDAPVSAAILTQYTSSVTVPSTAVENQPLRMRVVYIFAGEDNDGFSIPSQFACGTNFNYGETEDYNVIVASPLSTSETAHTNNGIQIYPNPVSDILNITKVSNKATYKIYSAAGQLVGNGNINAGKINVSSLIKGTYVITIEDKGKESFNSKFIKK